MAERKRVRRRETRRTKREGLQQFWPVLVVLLLVYGVGGFFFLRSVRSSPSDAGEAASAGAASPGEPGEAVPIQGLEHVEPGQSHPPYNTDPPTSGWHLNFPVPAGFYDEPQVDEALVHNLEHGHVVISYDCSKLADCEAVKAKLKDIVNRYDNWKVVATPRENKDAAIALTAWGRIAKLDAYDEDRFIAFINAYRDQGPEKTPR